MNSTEHPKGLKTFPAPEIDRVQFLCTELTAICPLNGQPDYYTIIIKYRPDEMCVETKSLKLYLQTYRDQEICAETLSAQIADDLALVAKPLSIRLELTQQVRGGIETCVTVLRNKDWEENHVSNN